MLLIILVCALSKFKGQFNYRIVGNFHGVQILYSCYLQLIRVFNFRSVHFTQENTPLITYFSCVKFCSDRLRMKRTKFGPHEYFPLYGIGYFSCSLLSFPGLNPTFNSSAACREIVISFRSCMNRCALK